MPRTTGSRFVRLASKLVAAFLFGGALILPAETPEALEVTSVPRIIKLRLETGKQVEQHRKMVFHLEPDSIFSNPYDPRDIALQLEFRTPSGRQLVLPAFYHQPYERRQVARSGRKADWMYPTGQPSWQARFAPTETGAYSCQAVLRDSG